MRQREQSAGSGVIFVSNTQTRVAGRDRETTMTANNQGTATIYQFPLRGRFASDNRELAKSSSPMQIVNVESGSGWYHQQAIEDATSRKN